MAPPCSPNQQPRSTHRLLNTPQDRQCSITTAPGATAAVAGAAGAAACLDFFAAASLGAEALRLGAMLLLATTASRVGRRRVQWSNMVGAAPATRGQQRATAGDGWASWLERGSMCHVQKGFATSLGTWRSAARADAHTGR